jgi:hypothetical protein
MFCGASGVTKAHVFAKSWTGHFDDPNDTRDHEVVHRYTDPKTGVEEEFKRSKTFGLISRKVCGPCNSGWLSELEERVSPLMGDFAANNRITLDPTEQGDLALWSAVAALIAMSRDPDSVGFADSSIARGIYQEREPPNEMNIWLGANSHGEMAWFRAHSLSLGAAPDQAGAWGATISFGYSVMHIVYHGLSERRMRLRQDAQRSLRRIWTPRDAFVWPPPLRMQPTDLSPLAHVIAEQSSFERAVFPHSR